MRFGYWAIGNNGSQQKTGEFQDLHSFPFWDVDAISSDGVRTWDIVLSGLDQETSDARIHYYGPEGSAKIDFQRFIHRLDHNPVVGYVLAPGEVPPPTPAGDVIADDLNVGEDYAIRVEELNSKFQGKITDNVKWRLNVWSQRKFGEAQANAMAHCFNVLADAPAGATGNVCHKLSQRQTIDWTTVEVKPGIEARFENVTVDYSHTIRTFGADDQAVDRTYTHFGFSPSNNILGPPYDYAIVPDSSTNIDRVKIAAAITDDNQFYGNLYHGETKNEFRDLERTYNGYDLRLTNRSIDDVKLTAYTSRYEEDNSFPPTIFDSPPLAPASTYDEDSLVHPVNYTRTRAGLKGSWQPYGDRGMRCSNYGIWDGTSLAAGYEYYQLERAYATYETTPIPPGPFTQPDTITHQVEFGPSTHWSRSLDTFVRYKVQFIDNPLVGVSQYSEEDPTIPGTFNSSLPERVNNVELGGTWTPASNFLTTAQFTIMNSSNRSDFANFSENDYPMVFTVWYAPTSRLSLTGGYAYYSNWIDQDITLGTYRGDPTATETCALELRRAKSLVQLQCPLRVE